MRGVAAGYTALLQFHANFERIQNLADKNWGVRGSIGVRATAIQETGSIQSKLRLRYATVIKRTGNGVCST